MAGLFKGAGPTVVRAMALNMGMLASNDQVWPTRKHLLPFASIQTLHEHCKRCLQRSAAPTKESFAALSFMGSAADVPEC